jgi:hypothetical protein
VFLVAFGRRLWLSSDVRQKGVARLAVSARFIFVPTVLRIGSFRFHFYSDERNEPAHIHVRTPEGECKFWLDPTVGLAGNRGVRAHDLRRIEQLIFEHEEHLNRAFNEYHHR